MNGEPIEADLLNLTADIVASHVSHNTIAADSLPSLIQSVFDALRGVGTSADVPPKPEPAVAIKRSVFPDYIVCLEDGKKLKMLKRHLATSYQITPQQYRERWGLPPDYPMVAPNYSQRRSALAKQSGLGRQPEPDPDPAPAAAPARRGRKKAE